MGKNCLLFFLLISLLSLLPNVGSAKHSRKGLPLNKDTNIQIAKLLGWTQQASGCLLCHGYYLQPDLNPKHIPAHKINHVATHITTDSTYMPMHKPWKLQGHVRAMQPGKLITAQRGLLYFNKKNKPKAIDLFGNVHVYEVGRLFVGDKAHIDLTDKQGSLSDAYYRFTIGKAIIKPITNSHNQRIATLSSWGHAKRIEQTSPKHFTFHHASFSTCLPHHPVWKMYTSTLTLNKISGRGEAFNMYLTLHGIPFFYTPYFNFPIDNRRESGLLIPNIGNSSFSGFQITLPYYFNLAPNYDFLLTTKLFAKRGALFSGQFRYLTKNAQGKMQVYLMPYDHGFMTLKQNARDNSTLYNPVGLSALENASTIRKAISIHHLSRFNDHVSFTVNAAWVSDAYFSRDFYTKYLTPNNEMQSLTISQQATLHYQSAHWNNAISILRYQTLEPIDLALTSQPYSLLPSISLKGNYSLAFGTQLKILSSFEHFTFTQALLPQENPFTGNRINIEPEFSRSFIWPYAFIKPQFSFMLTGYQIQHQLPSRRSRIIRALPITSLDAGLFFDRNTHLFNQDYDWSLEPRAKYLYIPYRNQFDIPMFNSSINSMYYSQLFSNNRFSNIDRVGDTNQITLGISSKLINQSNGETKLSASLGQIFLFSRQRVFECMSGVGCENTTPDTISQPISGLVKQSYLADTVTFSPTPFWRFIGQSSYDPSIHKSINYNFGMQYKRDSQHIINIEYNFLRNANVFSLNKAQYSSNDSKTLNLSAAWAISRRVTALAAYDTSLSENHLQDYLLGIEYNACCWAVRFVTGKIFYGFNPTITSSANPLGRPEFDKLFYFQFLLRGLAAIGNHDPSGFLGTAIPGYSGGFRSYEGQ